MTVDLFVTCLNDALFPETGLATARLLERLGHTVRFDERQTCCGQMHLNSGYPQEALGLVRRFVEIFENKEAVVVPSGSCAAMARELMPRAAAQAGDLELAERVKGLRVYELCELLVDVLGVEDVGAYYPHHVTYHPSCHAMRSLHVGDKPLRLLRNVRGMTLIELPQAQECCGFGGTFSVKNPETSAAMLADKVRAVMDTRAEVLTAGDNSCLMHVGGGLSRLRSGARTVHLAEILASTEATA